MHLGAGKFRKEKDNVSEDAQPWPSRISDVIPTPDGEKEPLSVLVQWAANVPGGHSIFSLIGALARFWEPFAVQLFQSLAVFGLATQHLRYEFDSYNPRASTPEQMILFRQ
jgi:hypothetical protein